MGKFIETTYPTITCRVNNWINYGILSTIDSYESKELIAIALDVTALTLARLNYEDIKKETKTVLLPVIVRIFGTTTKTFTYNEIEKTVYLIVKDFVKQYETAKLEFKKPTKERDDEAEFISQYCENYCFEDQPKEDVCHSKNLRSNPTNVLEYFTQIVKDDSTISGFVVNTEIYDLLKSIPEFGYVDEHNGKLGKIKILRDAYLESNTIRICYDKLHNLPIPQLKISELLCVAANNFEKQKIEDLFKKQLLENSLLTEEILVKNNPNYWNGEKKCVGDKVLFSFLHFNLKNDNDVEYLIALKESHFNLFQPLRKTGVSIPVYDRYIVEIELKSCQDRVVTLIQSVECDYIMLNDNVIFKYFN